MGSYLNPGNKGFCESLNSAIYVDKSGLIERTNRVLDTRQCGRNAVYAPVPNYYGFKTEIFGLYRQQPFDICNVGYICMYKASFYHPDR